MHIGGLTAARKEAPVTASAGMRYLSVSGPEAWNVASGACRQSGVPSSSAPPGPIRPGSGRSGVADGAEPPPVPPVVTGRALGEEAGDGARGQAGTTAAPTGIRDASDLATSQAAGSKSIGSPATPVISPSRLVTTAIAR